MSPLEDRSYRCQQSRYDVSPYLDFQQAREIPVAIKLLILVDGSESLRQKTSKTYREMTSSERQRMSIPLEIVEWIS